MPRLHPRPSWQTPRRIGIPSALRTLRLLMWVLVESIPKRAWGAGVSVARQRSAGMKKGEERTLPCRAYCQQRSSRLQVAHSSQAPLTIAGAPRTILDLTHRTLNAYYTRAGAHAHAQQAGTEMISCVSHTEYDTLGSAVIRCGDGWETILTWSVLQYTIPRKGSQPLSFRA